MTTEEDLYKALKPYCIEMGWIRFDKTTEETNKITMDSDIVAWKVLDYNQESAVEYLKENFPDVDESIIRKVISNNIKQTTR